MAIRDFDPVETLRSEASITAYLKTAVEQNDEEFYVDCLADAMRARAINQIAESTGIDRKRIYEMFSDPEIVARVQAVLIAAAAPTKTKELVQV